MLDVSQGLSGLRTPARTPIYLTAFIQYLVSLNNSRGEQSSDKFPRSTLQGPSAFYAVRLRKIVLVFTYSLPSVLVEIPPFLILPVLGHFAEFVTYLFSRILFYINERPTKGIHIECIQCNVHAFIHSFFLHSFSEHLQDALYR